MGDFTDKMSMGTSRMNPSSMVPGAMGGNAPQNGIGTQKGTIANLLKNNPSLAGGGNRTGAVPSPSMQNPFAQLPLSAAKPMGDSQVAGNGGGMQLFKLPMNPNGIPRGENDWSNPKVSSAKGGPTPSQHLQTGNWWEDYPEQPDGFLGSWAMSDEPIRKSQSDLPTDTQKMLGSPTPTQQKKKALKSDDFSMLASVFKTLSER